MCALSHGDIFNDIDGPLTRFSRSRHFWSRISEKRRVLKTKLLLHKRKNTLYMEWHYVWWLWLTSKCVAWVCQYQLSFLFIQAADSCGGRQCRHHSSGKTHRTSCVQPAGRRWRIPRETVVTNILWALTFLNATTVAVNWMSTDCRF